MDGNARSVVAAQAPKPRIVQYNKRRYSIRLESVFWQFLEILSEQRRVRLGRFIAGLANSYSGNNLSSYLRVVCMLEAERAVARAKLRPTDNSLLGIIEACPTPGIVISRTRTIIAYNDAFSEWMGPNHANLAGLELTSALQVRAPRSLSDIWSDMIAGIQPAVQAHVLHVTPGRVNAAQATIVPLRSEGGDGFHAVMWLATKAKGAPAARHVLARQDSRIVTESRGLDGP